MLNILLNCIILCAKQPSNSNESDAADHFERSISVNVTCGRFKDVSEFKRGQIIGLHQAQTCGRVKDVSEFKRGQIIGLHQAQKCCTEIGEKTLKTLQRIIKLWRDEELSKTSRRLCDRKSILCDRDWRSLKQLVKSTRRKSTLELLKMFNTGSKIVSSRTVRRKLKELGLNCCMAARKSLLSAIKRKKNSNLPRNI